MLDPTVLLLRTYQAHMITADAILSNYLDQQSAQRRIIEQYQAAQFQCARIMVNRRTQICPMQRPEEAT